LEASRWVLAVLVAVAVGCGGGSGRAAVAPEGESVARIVAIRGRAEAVSGGGAARAIRLKSPLFKGDTVKTGVRGRLQIHFLDNSLISLGRETEMLIEDFAYRPEESQGRLVTSVKQGVFRVMGGAIAKIAPDNFETRTPTATIGVRGSFYTGTQLGRKLAVVFFGGLGITVGNAAGMVAINTPSFGTIVLSEFSRPDPPRLFSMGQIDSLLMGLRGRALEKGRAAREREDDEAEDEGEPAPAQGEPEGGQAPEDQAPGADEGEGLEGDDWIWFGGDDEDEDWVWIGEGEDDEGEFWAWDGGEEGEDEGDWVWIEGGEGDEEGFWVWDGGEEGEGEGDWGWGWGEGGEEGEEGFWGWEGEEGEEGGEWFGEDDEEWGGFWGEEDDEWEWEWDDEYWDWGEEESSSSMPGGYVAALAGRAPGRQTTADTWWAGLTTADLVDGAIDGQYAAPDGPVFPFRLPVPQVGPEEPYTGFERATANHTVDLLHAPRDLQIDYLYDNRGEFAVFTARDAAVDDGFVTYDFNELGFSGAVPPGLPSDGLASYEGPGLLVLDDWDSGDLTSSHGNSRAAVNFWNGVAVGAFTADGASAPELFFYGQALTPWPSDWTLVGMGSRAAGTARQPGEPLAALGQATTRRIYGAEYQGLGTVGEADVYGLADESWIGQIAFGSGMFKDDEVEFAPTGVVPWDGFAIGVAEQVADPGDQPVVFGNQDVSGVWMDVDRDAGSISGNMDVYDPNGVASIVGVTVGGIYGSGYAADSWLVAELDGTGAVDVDGWQGDLKAGGAVLASTHGAAEKMSAWATWGYWGVAYDDPSYEAPVLYRVRPSAGLWVAGELTPREYVESLLGRRGARGTYSGGARCVEISPDGLTHTQHVGASLFDVVFESSSVSGTLAFQDMSMQASGLIDSGGNGFTGSIDSVDAARGRQTPAANSFQGDFFGPQANAIGGSFHADMEDATRYVGVFAADKQQ